MKTFSTSAVTTKPSQNVLHAAMVILTNNGFSIVHCDDQSADLTGPGLDSTRQNPLLGASKIQLKFRGQQLCLDAELGGVETMRKFLMRFTFLLGLALALLFGIVSGFAFGRQFGVGFGVPWAQGWTWLLVATAGAMLPVTPWLFLSPMIANMTLQRTRDALANLVQNSIQIS